jgi:GT2 family glycosyltransferase
MKRQAMSVIIPVYNDPENIAQCLAALLPTLGKDDEVIVVNDASNDNTAKVVAEFPVALIELKTNSGPAAARNTGAHRANNDILFFIDADILVHKDTLDKIKAYFERHTVDAFIGSYDTEPTQQNFISQYKNLSHHYVHQQADKIAKTFWGACGAIRKSAFQAVDGFSEAYRRPSIEDIELGYRLVDQGKNIHLVKEIQVTHTKKWTLTSLIRTDLFDRAIPWTTLMMKQKSLNNDLNTDYKQRLSLVLVWLSGIFLALGFFSSIFWLFAPATLFLMILINFSYFYFFRKKRSIVFALGVIPLHVLYYLYSGVGFIIGVAKAKYE